MIKTTLVTLLVFLAIDAVWLLGIARGVYQRAIGFLMPEQVSLVAAFGAYILIALGLALFVIVPGMRAGAPLGQMVAWGALFGLVTYGVYDFTNLATIKGWPLWISLVDMAWGATVSALTTLGAVWALRLFA